MAWVIVIIMFCVPYIDSLRHVSVAALSQVLMGFHAHFSTAPNVCSAEMRARQSANLNRHGTVANSSPIPF